MLGVVLCASLFLVGCKNINENTAGGYNVSTYGYPTSPDGWARSSLNDIESLFEHRAQPYAHSEYPENTFDDIPQDVFFFIIEYLNTSGISSELAETHFVRRYGVYAEYVEFFRKLTQETPAFLRYFYIEHASKINANLFVFTVYIEFGPTIGPADSTARFHMFVGIEDDEMFVLPSVGGVPEELSDGLDRERYRQSALDPRILDFGDTIIFELDEPGSFDIFGD